MSRRSFLKSAAAAGLAATAGLSITAAKAAVETVRPPKTGYASVNGLRMYYEIHGSGEPLVLLHGGLTTIETSFGALLPLLAAKRQVIAIEQQGHGHTGDIDRPLSYRHMADDTARLLQSLGIRQADFFGWSMGGGIALELALQQPTLTRKLALASISATRAGIRPELDELQRHPEKQQLGWNELWLPSPADFKLWTDSYARTAPDKQGFAKIAAKAQQLMGSFEGWSEAELHNVQAPTMVLIGDNDFTRPEHAVELFRTIGGGKDEALGRPRNQLAILPGTTHMALTRRAATLVPMLLAFFDPPAS
jgi:pimeloyl-ACP methyl ester carboxylesterase